jgi:hypothetical protein
MMLFWPFGKATAQLIYPRTDDPSRSAWSLTMAARAVSLPLPTFVAVLSYGFLGASLLHRYVDRVVKPGHRLKGGAINSFQ